MLHLYVGAGESAPHNLYLLQDSTAMGLLGQLRFAKFAFYQIIYIKADKCGCM